MVKQENGNAAVSEKDFRELEVKYEASREMMLHMLVENVIFNENPARNLTRDMEDILGVQFSSEAGSVLLVSINEHSDDLDKAVVIPTVERTIKDCFKVFAFVLFFSAGENMMGCYLSPNNLRNEDVDLLKDELTEETISFAIEACQKLEDKGINISIAVSSIDSKSSPKQLYREAQMVHDHCNSQGMRVAGKADLPTPIPRDRVKLAISERRFMTSVINRQYYDAVSALDEIMAGIVKESTPTVEQMRSSIFQRLEMVMTISGEALHPDKQDIEVMDALESIMQAKSFSELRERMFDFFAIADDCFITDQPEDKFASVKAFVEKNYTSSSMGAAMICESLKFSPSYLSKLVRKETGSGVVDFIHHVRITKAKELLEETSLSVQDIAESVGFANRWTFIRAFRNLENTNPSAYREKFR